MYNSRASFVKMPARTSCIFFATRGGSAKVFRLTEPPPAPDRRRPEDAAAVDFLPRLDGDFFAGEVAAALPGWRRTVVRAVEAGIAIPAYSSALAFYDGYRSGRVPANLIQAQRDFFGAHTYLRVDKPGEGPFHTEWGS